MHTKTHSLILQSEEINDNKVKLSPIRVNEEYLREWNESSRDFVMLTVNGNLISNSLYRLGGMGSKPDGENYFMLLKYVEAYYDKKWLKEIKSNSDPKHLEYKWCILDKNGIEKIVCDKFKSPSLIKNSCIYSLQSNFYNIETNEFYCSSYNSIESSEYLFLDNAYDDDKSRRGVWQINKKDGTYTILK